MMDETGTTNSDDAIGALVRLAGRRPPVSEDAAMRVRAAVHEEWMQTIGRRRRARWIGSAAAAACIAIVAILIRMMPSSPQPAPTPQRVAVATGQTTGAAIFANDVYEIADSGSASLAWGDATLRLDGGTRVRILSTRELSLERGAVYVASNGPGVVVRTPIGAVRDIGTQFEVRMTGDRMRVRVREGRIDLQQGNTKHSATAGTELDAGTRGDVTQHSIPRSGAEWNWVVRAAPPIRLDGRTLAEVVGAVTREEGVTPVWSDSAARAAASIRLHGSIPLTPYEALDSALVASGLTARTEGDRLIIRRKK